MSQRFDRIKARCAKRRIQASRNAREEGHSQCQQDAATRRVGLQDDGDVLKDLRESPTEQHAQSAAKHADHAGFQKKLKQNVAALGPDSHPYADLAGALRHRDQHDVGDPNSADDQRYSRDAVEHDGHDVDKSADALGDLLFGHHAKVVWFAGANAVFDPQLAFDFLRDALQLVAVLSLDGDELHVLITEQARQPGRQRNDHLFIHVAHTEKTFFLHHADNRKSQTADANPRPDSRRLTEQFLRHLMTQDANFASAGDILLGQFATTFRFVAVDPRVVVVGREQLDAQVFFKVLDLRGDQRFGSGVFNGVQFAECVGVGFGQRQSYDAARRPSLPLVTMI